MSSAGKVIVDRTGTILTKRHRQRGGRLLPGIPSLQEFVHKQTVLRQYRHFLKAVAVIKDNDHKLEAQQEVMLNFRRDSMETNALSIQMAVKDGERRLSQVRSLVGYSIPEDSDSWLSTDDADDRKGRVGKQWPWQR